jgi:uncharacterized caspase-like protein
MQLKLTALAIGNSTSDHGEALKDPTNDAEDLYDKLTYLRFSVTTLTNATKEEMKTAIQVQKPASTPSSE